jgi:hypothetical protein
MTAAEFDAVLSARLAKTREVLAAKAGEYASAADRLHNFKRAASWFPLPSEQAASTAADACCGMMRKHWVSLADLVDRKAAGLAHPPAVVDEKIGDAVNYLILLEALLRE